MNNEELINEIKFANSINRTINSKFLTRHFGIFLRHKTVIKSERKKYRKIISKNKITKNQKVYLEFIYELLHKVDHNISELAEDIMSLKNNKNLMGIMFLLRGIMELVYFNIYLSHNLKKHINNKNFNEFIKLCCRANLASGEESIKSKKLSKDLIISKILKKFDNKRIHINDCIRYYQKTDLAEEAIKFIKSMKFENEKFLKFFQNSDHVADKGIIMEAYDRLCEVIHPTALMINDTEDKDTQLDFKEITLKIAGSMFFLHNIHCYTYKNIIFEKVLENKDEIINHFKKIIQ